MSRKDDQLPDGGKVIGERDIEQRALNRPIDFDVRERDWQKSGWRKFYSANDLFPSIYKNGWCDGYLAGYDAGEKERDDLRAEVERLRTAMRDAASETGTSTLTHKILREALKEETKGE